MRPGDAVHCADGLVVVQRGAPRLPGRPVLRVGAVAEVVRPGGAPIEARNPDNVVWRRHWSEPERLVIEFVGVADVAVGDVDGTVTFDRSLAPDLEQHLLFDHVLPLVLARRGALVVHGGVISRGGRGVVLVGSSGAGKSTLTTFAWQRGWTVGGDDGAVLFAGHPPMVQPTYATVRLTPASAELLGIDPGTTAGVVGKLRLLDDAERGFRQEPVELRLIAILDPVPEDEPARFEPLGGIEAHAELFGSTFHADLSRDRRLPRIVDDLAGIVETSVVGRLKAPRGLEGLAASERLLRRLVEGGPESLGSPARSATPGTPVRTVGGEGR